MTRDAIHSSSRPWKTSSRLARIRHGLLATAIVLLASLATTFAQKAHTTAFEFPDRVVKVVAPEFVKVEKAGDAGFKITYTVNAFIDSGDYGKRIFLEVKTTFLKPQSGTTAVVEMSPFENPATFHAWNPDDKAAYTSFDQNSATIDLNSMTYKNADGKFSGEVKAICFSTTLSTDQGDHVVEIQKFGME